MQNKVFNPLLNETFLIRPTDKFQGSIVQPDGYKHPKEILRYAEGKWIPDDGKPDLAFIHGVFYYGVDIPHTTNLLWSWYDFDLTKSFLPEYLHKVAKKWHSYTINDTVDGDDSYEWDNSNHPNEVANKIASDRVCEINGCANGVLAQLLSESEWTKPKWISDKLILIKSTMKPVTKPENITCYLCKDNGRGHYIEALKDYKEDLEYHIEENETSIGKAQSMIYDCEDENEKYKEELEKATKELNTLEDK